MLMKQSPLIDLLDSPQLFLWKLLQVRLMSLIDKELHKDSFNAMGVETG